ncbi:hypothetical protein Tco_0308895 [Tanacetum coccineum]
MYYPRFTKVIIYHFLIQEKSLSRRNRIGMHTSKDDYLINSLRFVSAKESTKIYGAILPECLTSLAMKESKAYKTYLGYASGAVPPKVAKKFKKASPSKKDSDIVPVDEEPVTKGKRVKRSIKKSSTKLATRIELLSEVALTEEAHMKEVRKKSLRDFHKTHPSGSGTVSEKPPSVDKITPSVTSEGTDDSNNDQESSNEGSEQENESEKQESNSEQEEESEDDDQEEEEFVPTPSPTDDKDDDDLESESDDVIKSDEEKLMDDTTYQFDDDVDARLKETTQTDKEIKTEVFVTNVQPTPLPTIETTNPLSILPEFAFVFRFNDKISALEKEVAELKKDPLHTQVTTLVDEHLDTRLGETREEFMNFLSESLTARIKEQVKDQLPQILPKEVSNFAPPVIQKLIKESCDEVNLVKVSSQPHSTYEAAST